MVGDGIGGAVVGDGFCMGLVDCGDGVGGVVIWKGTGLVGSAAGGVLVGKWEGPGAVGC